MYHWVKIVIYIGVVLHSLGTVKNAIFRYKENKENYDLLECIAKIILIPASAILLIAEIIEG